MITGFTHNNRNIIITNANKWVGIKRVVNVIDATDHKKRHFLAELEVETVDGIFVLDWVADAALEYLEQQKAA